MRHHRASPDHQAEQAQSSSSAAGPSFSSAHQRSSKSPAPPMDAHSITTSTGRHAGERTASPTGIKFTARRPSPSPSPEPNARHTTTSAAAAEKQPFSPRAFTMPSRKSTVGGVGNRPGRSSTGGSTWPSSDSRRLSGTVHHRGRHANDWLFGGFSLRDQITRLWSNDSSNNESPGTEDDARRRRSGSGS